MKYFRLHVTYKGKTGKPVGIFGACHHLKRAGRLTADEVILFEEIDAWYTENLLEPPFYAKGNLQKAITWFKDTPEVHTFVKGLDPLLDLLKKYGVEHKISWTTNPGEIIYEDEYQVAVI